MSKSILSILPGDKITVAVTKDGRETVNVPCVVTGARRSSTGNGFKASAVHQDNPNEIYILAIDINTAEFGDDMSKVTDQQTPNEVWYSTRIS